MGNIPCDLRDETVQRSAESVLLRKHTTPDHHRGQVSGDRSNSPDVHADEANANPTATDLLKNILLNKATLIEWGVPLFFVFGGCCSNMFALESIVKYEANSGLAITLIQMLFTTLVTATPQIHFSTRWPWVLRRPKLPLRALLFSAFYFCVVNMMNNWAFGFRISVPVHIILRSGGSVTSMAVGYLHGRKYSRGQVLGVSLLTAGVIVAALADAKAKGKATVGSRGSTRDFVNGLFVLLLAQLLSAEMGLYTESMYRKYGRHWRDNLLWSHLLSIIFFVFVAPQIKSQVARLLDSDGYNVNFLFFMSPAFEAQLPKQVIYLGLNAATQFLCIQGVSRLASTLSPLTVTVVLNVRKLMSLVLSIWLFGNDLPVGVWVGAAFVFSGGMVYAGWDLKSPNSDFKEKQG